jgi:hypothetical protein
LEHSLPFNLHDRDTPLAPTLDSVTVITTTLEIAPSQRISETLHALDPLLLLPSETLPFGLTAAFEYFKSHPMIRSIPAHSCLPIIQERFSIRLQGHFTKLKAHGFYLWITQLEIQTGDTLPRLQTVLWESIEAFVSHVEDV